MKSAQDMNGEQFVYIPFTSIQNISSLQGLTLSKDILVRIPSVADGSIPFLDLSQAPTLTLEPGIIENNSVNHNESHPVEEDKMEVTTDLVQKKKSKSDLVKCMICGESFPKGISYKRHMEFHKNMKKFKCKHCFESYNVEDNFKLHMAIHNSGTPTCPLCNRKFQRLASLKSHLLMHEVEETFTCKECQAEFDKETDYYKHLEKHNSVEEPQDEKVPFTCTYCNYVFEDRKGYKEHVAFHMKLKKFVFNSKHRKRKTACNKDHPNKCSICDKSFTKSCLLERHMRVHTGERPFECPKCNKRFTQKNTLTVHLAKHEGYKPYKCTLCPASFFQKGNLRVHVQKTHIVPQGVSKVYKCTQCTCVFKKLAPLNAHVTKAHCGIVQVDDIDAVTEKLKELSELTSQGKSKEEPFPIEHLNRVVENPATDTLVRLSEGGLGGIAKQYVVTQRKVNDVKTYVCSYCTKEFKKPSDLIRHLRIHTNEKPFECHICKQTYTLKSTLRTHMNTHVGKKEYQCVVCLNYFSSVRNLNIHLRTHGDAGQRLRYKCTACSKLFTSLQMVCQHLKVHTSSSDEVIPTEGQPKSQMLANALLLKQPLVQIEDGPAEEVPPPKPLGPYLAPSLPKSRPYRCHLCQAGFHRCAHLKRHMKSHSAEKLYRCTACPKMYSSPLALQNHKYVHDDRKYFCSFCYKRFGTKTLLQRHLTSMHMDRKHYVCPYCDKKYRRVDQCRSHISKVHMKEAMEQSGIKISNGGALEGEMLDLKTVQTADSYLEEALKINSEEINKTKEELEKLRGLNDAEEVEPTDTVLQVGDDSSTKQQEYTITLPEGIQLQNMEIGQNLTEDPQNFSTIYISYNDIQQMGTTIYDPLTSQVEYQAVDPLLNEPQDVNILFVDSLTQNSELPAEHQNFETFNQDMFTNGIQTSEPTNIPIDISNSADKSEIVVPIAAEMQDKLNIDHGTQPNLILRSDNQDLTPQDKTLNENIVITLNHIPDQEGMKTSDFNYLQNIMGLNQAEVVTPHPVDISFVSSVGNILYGDIGNGAVSCAVCKISCDNISDLAKHQCVANENVNEENNGLNSDLVEEHAKEQDSSVAIHLVDEEDNIITVSPGLLKTEKRLKSKQEVRCNICTKQFKKSSDLERHLRTHTGERPFGCPKCNKSFSLKSTLNTHMRTHDRSDSTKVSCHICNSTYSCKASLKTHMSIHTGVKPYACNLCPAKFRTSAHRKTHIENHAKNNQRRKTTLKSNIKNTLNYANNYFESLLVNGGTDGAGNANINLQTVIEPTTLNAVDPTENLTIGDSLPIEFLQLHNGSFLLPDAAGDVLGQLQFDIGAIPEKSIQADMTEQLPSLNPKLFECSICNKQYSSKSVLKKHQKNHKDFNCSKCGKEFDSIDAVEKHSKVHQGYRPYSCLHCLNSFSDAAALKTHIKRIHKLLA